MGHRLRLRRGADAVGDDKGAAAVEFAIVFPVILLLVLGIMEFALLLRDYVGVSNVVRDASRVASAGPRQGNVLGHRGHPPCPPAATCPPTPAGTAPAGAVASFAYNASQVLSSKGSAIPTSSIVDMWVYKANAKGFPEGLNDFSSCPPAVCVRYAWDTVPTPTFEYRSGTWDPASINACPNDANAMSVGVYMRVAHSGLFPAFFNTTFPVNDASVLKFEPLRPGAGSCKP
jgi:hypothetical protein